MDASSFAPFLLHGCSQLCSTIAAFQLFFRGCSILVLLLFLLHVTWVLSFARRLFNPKLCSSLACRDVTLPPHLGVYGTMAINSADMVKTAEKRRGFNLKVLELISEMDLDGFEIRWTPSLKHEEHLKGLAMLTNESRKYMDWGSEQAHLVLSVARSVEQNACPLC